jgi:aromatic ring-opening dioxygenase LigB subunit
VIVRGAIVPHAPVLVESIQPGLDAGRWLRDAIAELDLEGVETVVVVSPHGASAGVYADPNGSLMGFGIPGPVTNRRGDDDLGRIIAEAWRRPQLEEPADFGVVVPLVLGLGGELPIVGATLPEITGPRAVAAGQAISAAAELTHAIEAIAGRRDLAVVASAHSSAGLSARAPLTEVPGAEEADAALRDALTHDPARVIEIIDDLHSVGDACGIAPLAALAPLLSGLTNRRLRYESPFGVSYLVGEWAA